MNDNDNLNSLNNNHTNSKSLSDLFKEVQDIRYGRAEALQREEPEENIKFNRIYVVNQKFNALGAIIGILFLILFFSITNSGSTLASTEKKVAIGEFEENMKSLDMMGIISTNISELTTKEIVEQQVEIEFPTKYVENKELPRDEQLIVQEGVLGYKELTIIRTYENGELVSENIISDVLLSSPVDKIVEVGTSDFLKDKQVHIGDYMYTTEEIFMYPEQEEGEEIVCKIYKDIDVKLLAESDGWAKVVVDGYEGFVRGELLTSEALNPGISERARIKRLQLGVKEDMRVNKKSGLTREDFIRVLSGHDSDRNHIFEENAGLFYDIEQHYNVNGLFIASIGIHESNWGTSNIANQKKNLFGYGAYDNSAFTSSYTFESYEYGIELLAKVLSKYYLNVPGTIIYDNETAVGSYFNGPTIKDVNVRYASDPNWANRVFSIMKSLYERL